MDVMIPEIADSQRDDLTGLPDAASAYATLARWQADYAARGHTAPIHAMLLGLGRFDTVNLAYGEATGDGALVEVARRILHFAEDEFESGTALVARIGGGQFLIAALDACSRERWQWLADALADAVALPIADLDAAGTLRLWPRVALMRATKGEGPDIVLDRLAQTLAQARAEQARRVLWADGELTLPGKRAAQLEADLLAALDRDEIEILYQPQFALEDDRLTGAEALARWQHPELGRIGAGALFAIAERADHVAQLSRHIAKRALEGAKDWPEHLRLSLNVTPADLAAGSFADEFSRMLAKSGFPADRLTLEITEQVLVSDLERASASLERLHEQGIRIALDDFGAGFCNFRYLKLLPLDYLKLDRAMVDGVVDDHRDLAVLRGIVAMAKALDLKLIAEGIENEDQRAIIAAEGCDFYQGFLKAEPMGAGEFMGLAGG
ncbi:MAG: EAL domain-containing protein [Sphingomonadaceae bacterium]|nr:EAL domain-containing protein [Sphingomonadaceae bacterium]